MDQPDGFEDERSPTKKSSVKNALWDNANGAVVEQQINPEFKPTEDELNNWAYRMMSNNQQKEALEIFKLNVYLFPKSWNAYDSYGEILLNMGDKNKAIEMYKKSIDLNPNNENGKKILTEITSK